ncbi:NACHT domain-containing protein [Streptomyces sp. NRRL F-5650]|uniref:NACHT domain-containing protein n=1 Tax=Streptomyces sp. NRRL F-5650 TaxID=1463868 RepID=UPI0004C9F6DD|nr:NACHT domain-containing protein [Streptomyces sp. NRRL F-5650]
MEAVQHDGLVATVVVDRYREAAHSGRNRDYLRGAAAKFVEQTRRLGFVTEPIGVTSSRDDAGPVTAGREQIRDLIARLRKVQASRKILYWTGHGHEDGDTFYLACEDSYVDGRLDPSRAVSAQELASWMGNDLTDTWLVLDACFSGAALDAVEDRMKRARKQEVGDDPAGGFVAVATAGADERATETRWVDCLEQVLDTPDLEYRQHRIFAREQPDLPLDYLHGAIAARMRGGQAPRIAVVRTLRPLFLVNPYCSDRVRPATRPEDDESWIGEEFRSDSSPLFAGGGETWQLRDFSPRDGALGSLVTWMNVRSTGMYVVTGASGAGKSTLLRYVAHLTTKPFAAALERLPPVQPELHSVHAVLHCRGRTLASLCQELAARLEYLGLDRHAARGTVPSFVKAVSELADYKGTLTLLLDGLDECAVGHAFRVARELLNPLALLPRVKVVVATRANARRALPGEASPESLVDVLAGERVLELDRLAGTELDLARYVEDLLRRGRPSPATPEEQVARDAVARHVAASSNGLFLVATLWARQLAELDTLPGPDRLDAELRHGAAALDSLLAQELRRLDPEDPCRIRDLLRPLALAQGNGLPPGPLWLAVANATRDAEREYDEADLQLVVGRADGVVLARDAEFGEPVYRFHHPSFGGHLLAGLDERRLHARTQRALRPASDGDWDAVAPYAAHYLAAHAALAGDRVLEDLLSDWRFLVHASPEVLEPLVAARVANSPQAALYLTVADQFRTGPEVGRERLIAGRWAVLRATALVMFSAQHVRDVPRAPGAFWDDLWTSAERLPSQRIWPAPSGGACAVHWERDGDGLIHAAGRGDITSWTWAGREARLRETGTPRPGEPVHLAGVVATGAGRQRVVAAHDGRAVRVWWGEERRPSEEFYWGGRVESLDMARWEGRSWLAATVHGQLWLWHWTGDGRPARRDIGVQRIPDVESAALVPLPDDLFAVIAGARGIRLRRLTGRESGERTPRYVWEGTPPMHTVRAIPSPDGAGATIAALDGVNLRVWEVPDLYRDDCRLLLRRESRAQASALALGRTASGLVVAVQEDRHIRLWTGEGAEQVPLPCDHEHKSLAFDPLGSGRLAVADETRVRVWDPHGPGRSTGARRAPVSSARRGNPRVHVAPAPDGGFLAVRAQGRSVLLSRHTTGGDVTDGPVLEHPGSRVTELTAVSALCTDQGAVVVAVGRRQAVAWTCDRGMRVVHRDELPLQGTDDDPVHSVALHADPDGRVRLFWPRDQGVRCWERPAGAGSRWRDDGRAVVHVTGAGTVDRLAVVNGPGGVARLAGWGGAVVRLWDLADLGAGPLGFNEPDNRPIAADGGVTGFVRLGRARVPLIAYPGARRVYVVRWIGDYPHAKAFRPPDGMVVDRLALAGPPDRLVLVGWRNDSGRIMLRDLVEDRDLPALESRGYHVTDVGTFCDDRGLTLMVQGTEQAGLRCDQVLLRQDRIAPWWDGPQDIPGQRTAAPDGSTRKTRHEA